MNQRRVTATSVRQSSMYSNVCICEEFKSSSITHYSLIVPATNHYTLQVKNRRNIITNICRHRYNQQGIPTATTRRRR